MEDRRDPTGSGDDETPLDVHALGKLRWRCRRGLLENDLLLDRFFERQGACITVRHARGLAQLMDLSDPDLLDLLLRRSMPTGILAATPEACEVLALLQPALAARDGA